LPPSGGIWQPPSFGLVPSLDLPAVLDARVIAAAKSPPFMSRSAAIVGHAEGMTESIPIGAFLEPYPEPIRTAAERLRHLVRRAEPDAIERVREGRRIIGYDIPVGRRTQYFAWIGPEAKHVHIGFEHGVLLPDPNQRLQGAHLRLKKVRYLTFTSPEQIDEREVLAFLRETVRIATLSRAERMGLAAEAWELVETQEVG
jgi:hypothetical protein